MDTGDLDRPERTRRWRIASLAVVPLVATAVVGGHAMTAPAAKDRPPLPPLADARIVISKADRRLDLLDGTALVRSYRAALGGRPVGTKRREGDRRTPEGVYYVCTKNARSRYCRALGISYPGIADARRGLREGAIDEAQHDAIVRAIEAGARPPWDTPLGGEIMVHGDGAGRDWTLGCIALENDDILELFDAVPLGTPVEIRP
jgi:murein L,D-transpeptidase YafK